MAKKVKTNPGDVSEAFRKAAKELDCLQSEQRFQHALFVIGRHKPVKPSVEPRRQKPPGREV